MVLLRECEGIICEEYRKYQVRTSIHHWQLRDMISGTNNPNEVVYVYANSINVLNTKSEKIHTISRNLVFNPTAICYNDEIVGVGGQRSQLYIKNIATGADKKITTGGSINNGLEIFSHFGDKRILVCNNDETVKEYSIDNMRRCSIIEHDSPVNNCSVNASGRILATVGDSNEVSIYTVGREKYPLIKKMKAMNDASFKVSWSPSGVYLAASTQDGYVCVYDIRNMNEKIQAIRSVQGSLVKGACRNVKFCPDSSMDLLVFTEHVSHFTVVDIRDFSKRQSIAVTGTTGDKHISGLSFGEDGRKLYIGTEMVIYEFGLNLFNRRLFQSGSLN
ncbi:hypothetical protein NEPAR06_0862 [Nematocida parisii]|uniref:DUF2415 domain-containing protein n=1 Tax=Nematocida parisii (strain ERTm3) TaxID=935791 RepID=I3EER4_NEMP3|nr:uncharacterized protein NEPG_02340 [Nematocida parisii ERTm1]EIJ87711.1 hypothetical protein NEQG_02258 [Nematocida parisii ERTm3]KAI5127739.1 hypothetical protein NEPAR03_1078 [Nematocida parisii]EIJ92941.1 hypothetical protein NEPG_02340 [Nematocida parisii ERTm1]KAI5128891.1 hypothetical protein NEPAR08_1378 [Nematocida parisii]KAI5141580.1 hypothetical protein NEPAR04_1070 [Nematocida parisii]|eukprot:XP_013060167.1 hypothetical protein NEPG_02340 [Nematocida parisii ERTm1]